MKRWSERGAVLALVAGGWLAALSGCSSEPEHNGAASKASSKASGTAGVGGGKTDATEPAAGSGETNTAAKVALAGEPTFSAIYAEILTKGATGNCMFGACHGGAPDPAVNGGLQIRAGDKAGAYKNLVDAKSTGMVCTGKTYVIPGDSAGSLLIRKFSDTPPCGGTMPIGPPLTAAQIAQIAKWIDDGAEDN